MISKLGFLGQPREVLARLRKRAGASLLESANLMPGLSGWSYIACDPVMTLETRSELTVLREGSKIIQFWDNPFTALEIVFEHFKLESEPRPEGMNFAGGWLGFLGYDLTRYLEEIPIVAPKLEQPNMRLHLMDFILAFDHANQTWYSSSIKFDFANREHIWAEILERAEHGISLQGQFKSGKLEPLTKPDKYLEQVEQCLNYIRAGDIFQVNLTHRLETDFTGDAFALYQALMFSNPAPFSAFISGEDLTVVGASPERFLKRTGTTLEARPIKGTVPRGAIPSEDELQKNKLEQSEKDRAENLMIVDLMRNDLGRVAEFGSVKTSKLFSLEPHGAVWQMVSTITAELKPNLSSVDVLRATFPPGSMTGAPKIRAMQIIEELEPVRRGVYSGVIGYFDLNGDFDLSVVIRSAIISNGKIKLQSGGAIVADSIPELELEETYAKTRALRTVLGQGNL